MTDLAIHEETTDTRASLTTTVPASPATVWELLRDPSGHAQIDGSDMVQAAAGSEPIQGTGDVFVMDMLWTDGSTAYRTDNHVTQFEPEQHLEWLVAEKDQEPAGWTWGWLLAPVPGQGTRVTNFCDWSRVTDQDLIEEKGFPLVDQTKIARTLQNLATAVSGPDSV